MSSAILTETLPSANITTLSRVLDTAGIFDLNTPCHSERRLRLGRPLIKAFQGRLTSESQLVDLAVSSIEMLHPSFVPGEPIDRPTDISLWERDRSRVSRFRTGRQGPAKAFT